jgi:hypothetical protein
MIIELHVTSRENAAAATDGADIPIFGYILIYNKKKHTEGE